MKILLAASDRDLLECYKKLLESDIGETVTAFDGTQVISLMNTESFDIIILDRDIPRADYRILIEKVRNKNIPLILLTDDQINTHQLLEKNLPNVYLSYPFVFDQLNRVINDTIEKKSQKDILKIGDIEVDLSESKFKNGPLLTYSELDVIQSLLNDETVMVSSGSYISAINEKLSRISSEIRIKYKQEKGFKLVTKDE